MTKARALLALVAMVGLGWAASGCSNSCDDLEELCDKCSDATRASTCRSNLSYCRLLPSGPGPSESDCCDPYLDTYDNC